MSLPLFDTEPVAPTPRVSPDRRRTLRQRAALDAGWHPLSLAFGHLLLHADAAPVDDRQARGRRCGDCRYRMLGDWRHARSYPKCWHGYQHADAAHPSPPPRISNGAATDVRAWWPACQDHEYGEPALSDDAARWVP